MNKRCFVISPIGNEGSEIREHADDVFEFIIQPAMDELNIDVYRADHTHQIGRITDQMFNSILTEDLCIAILTGYNPNVFYELAIAQSAARPVIILIEKGLTIPFDIHDLRAVEYDLKPRPLRDRVYVNQIIEIVKSLEAEDWHVEVPFGNNLSPLGSTSGSFNVYDRLESFGTSDHWMSLLEDATKAFDLTGVTLRWWIKLPSFQDTLLEKAKHGCNIRLLLMHQDNPTLEHYLNSHASGTGRLDRVVSGIKGSHKALSEIAVDQPNIQVRQVLSGIMNQQITRNDNLLLFSPMLHSVATDQAPLFECSSTSDVYQVMVSEFEELWNMNSPEDK